MGYRRNDLPLRTAPLAAQWVKPDSSSAHAPIPSALTAARSCTILSASIRRGIFRIARASCHMRLPANRSSRGNFRRGLEDHTPVTLG
jgi:hypothetical protein